MILNEATSLWILILASGIVTVVWQVEGETVLTLEEGRQWFTNLGAVLDNSGGALTVGDSPVFLVP